MFFKGFFGLANGFFLRYKLDAVMSSAYVLWIGPACKIHPFYEKNHPDGFFRENSVRGALA